MDERSNSHELGSWKEIAAYLGKTVRTVQRWERTLGLPVHRIQKGAKQYTVAKSEEIEAWLRGFSQPGGKDTAAASGNKHVVRLRELTHLMNERGEELRRRVSTVMETFNAAQKRRGARNGMAGGGLTILAVDDNEVHNYVLSRLLEASGFRVMRAFSGQQALVLAADHPHLILLDINLPDLSGFDVCKRLRADPVTAGIPVVYVTAQYRDLDTRTETEAACGETILFYPVETNHLLSVIEGQIGKSSQSAA